MHFFKVPASFDLPRSTQSSWISRSGMSHIVLFKLENTINHLWSRRRSWRECFKAARRINKISPKLSLSEFPHANRQASVFLYLAKLRSNRKQSVFFFLLRESEIYLCDMERWLWTRRDWGRCDWTGRVSASSEKLILPGLTTPRVFFSFTHKTTRNQKKRLDMVL